MLVDSGPYRWVRHPSYTGSVLLMASLGLVYGNVPAWRSCWCAGQRADPQDLRREAILSEVIGRAYADYAARTKRLVPGLW